jgi:hypothetical protein
MLNGKKAILGFLILVSSCASISAADIVIINYVKSGLNGGYPFDSLKVFQSGKADLITTSFNSSTIKSYQLTQVELNALIKLFTDNNYSSLDSMYMSGCLACPVYSITYGNKRVRGNFTGGSTQLANIKAGLDTLVNKIRNATPIIFSNSNPVNSSENASSSFRVRLSLRNNAGPIGIKIVRTGNPGTFTFLGQRLYE